MNEEKNNVVGAKLFTDKDIIEKLSEGIERYKHSPKAVRQQLVTKNRKALMATRMSLEEIRQRKFLTDKIAVPLNILVEYAKERNNILKAMLIASTKGGLEGSRKSTWGPLVDRMQETSIRLAKEKLYGDALKTILPGFMSQIASFAIRKTKWGAYLFESDEFRQAQAVKERTEENAFEKFGDTEKEKIKKDKTMTFSSEPIMRVFDIINQRGIEEIINNVDFSNQWLEKQFDVQFESLNILEEITANVYALRKHFVMDSASYQRRQKDEFGVVKKKEREDITAEKEESKGIFGFLSGIGSSIMGLAMNGFKTLFGGLFEAGKFLFLGVGGAIGGMVSEITKFVVKDALPWIFKNAMKPMLKWVFSASGMSALAITGLLAAVAGTIWAFWEKWKDHDKNSGETAKKFGKARGWNTEHLVDDLSGEGRVDLMKAADSATKLKGAGELLAAKKREIAKAEEDGVDKKQIELLKKQETELTMNFDRTKTQFETLYSEVYGRNSEEANKIFGVLITDLSKQTAVILKDFREVSEVAKINVENIKAEKSQINDLYIEAEKKRVEKEKSQERLGIVKENKKNITYNRNKEFIKKLNDIVRKTEDSDVSNDYSDGVLAALLKNPNMGKDDILSFYDGLVDGDYTKYFGKDVINSYARGTKRGQKISGTKPSLMGENVDNGLFEIYNPKKKEVYSPIGNKWNRTEFGNIMADSFIKALEKTKIFDYKSTNSEVTQKTILGIDKTLRSIYKVIDDKLTKTGNTAVNTVNSINNNLMGKGKEGGGKYISVQPSFVPYR